METYKKISESRTTQVHIIMPEHINGSRRLFGGKLAEWIDVVAGVVGRRHANCNVTTACMDHLKFEEPAYENDTIVLDGRITHVGNTSMEVRVDSYAETLSGERRLVNRAYLVMVALGPNGKPVRVPRVMLETDEEQTEWEAGEKRRKLREARALENY